MSGEKVSEYWGKWSRGYFEKQWASTPVARFDFERTKEIIEMFPPAKGSRVLEIGCGPGAWTGVLAGKAKKVTSIDISKEMLEEAKKRTRAKNVDFLLGDFCKMELRGKFDRIYLIRSLEYFPDKERTLKKCFGLLDDNGLLLVITKSKPCLWGITNRVFLKKHAGGFWQEKISDGELKKILSKIGFKRTKSYPAIIRLPIFAQGNFELPIVPSALSKPVLGFFKIVTTFARKANFFNRFWFIFSESFAVAGEKQA